jgi:hypothetical protein
MVLWDYKLWLNFNSRLGTLDKSITAEEYVVRVAQKKPTTVVQPLPSRGESSNTQPVSPCALGAEVSML